MDDRVVKAAEAYMAAYPINTFRTAVGVLRNLAYRRFDGYRPDGVTAEEWQDMLEFTHVLLWRSVE